MPQVRRMWMECDAMTAKEQQRMQRLEIENRELRNSHKNHTRIYGDNLMEIIKLKANLELIESALRGGD